MNPPCDTVKETQGFMRSDSETLALFVPLKFLRAILFKRLLTVWHYLFFFFWSYCNLNASISTFNAVPKVEANTFITPPRMMWLGSVDPIVLGDNAEKTDEQCDCRGSKVDHWHSNKHCPC